jgi:hypothetical protein
LARASEGAAARASEGAAARAWARARARARAWARAMCLGGSKERAMPAGAIATSISMRTIGES